MSTTWLIQFCPLITSLEREKATITNKLSSHSSVIKRNPLEWPLEMKSTAGGCVILSVTETHPGLHAGGHQLWASLRMMVTNTELGGNPHGNSAATAEETGHFKTGSLQLIWNLNSETNGTSLLNIVFKECVPAPPTANKTEIGICSLHFLTSFKQCQKLGFSLLFLSTSKQCV